MTEKVVDRFLTTERGKRLLREGDIVLGATHDEARNYIRIDFTSPSQESPITRKWFFESFADYQGKFFDERSVFEYKGIPWVNPSYSLAFLRDSTYFTVDATPDFLKIGNEGISALRSYVAFAIKNYDSQGAYVFQACYSLDPRIEEVGGVGDLGSMTFSSPLYRENPDDYASGLKEYAVPKINGKTFKLGTNAPYRLQTAEDGAEWRFVSADSKDEKSAFMLVVEHIDVTSLERIILSEESTWRNIIGRFPISAQLLESG